MIARKLLPALTAAVLAISFGPAWAQSAASNGQGDARSQFWTWVTGDYSIALGAAPYLAPRYEGSKQMMLSAQPQISLSVNGSVPRFSSINDNSSIGILDTGRFTLGPVAKILMQRDQNTSSDLRGLKTVPMGVEAGIFADLYPTDWLRLRVEAREGIRSYSGIVGDFWADAFTDLTPTLRLSGGPRLSLASTGYFDAYYGVTPTESAASGLGVYRPSGGLHSAGFGGALTWKATDRITTSLYAEYTRLLGAAANSSLIQQRGTVDQFLVGVSATYRFDFSIGKPVLVTK